MANFSDDFESYGTGAGIPTGYTGRWNYGSSEWSRVLDTDVALQHVESNIARTAVTLNSVDGDTNRANCDILVRVKGTVGVGSLLRAGVVGRASGAAGAETGYTCAINDTELRIGKYSGGASSQLGLTTGKNLGTGYYWIRFRINGTTSPVSLKARIWTGLVSDEVTTGWDLEVSDSTSPITAAGWVGLFSFADGTKNWRDLAVGTNGGTAVFGVPTVTATMAAVETGSDVFSASVTIPATAVQASLTATESGPDVLTASASVLVQASMAATETGADVLAGTASVLVQASLAIQETGSDTFTSSGTVTPLSGVTANIQETGSDTMAAQASVQVTASLGAQEVGSDAFASSVTLQVTASLSASESGSDTFLSTAEGAPIRTVTMAATESGSDSFVANCSVMVTAIAGAVESGADLMVAAASVLVRASAAMVESGSDYFEGLIGDGLKVKAWTGTHWKLSALKVWNGTVWTRPPARRRTANNWT